MKGKVFTVRCSKCRAEWVPRIPNPIRCPRCGNKMDGKPKRDYEYAPRMSCRTSGCSRPAMVRRGGYCQWHWRWAKKGKEGSR